MESYNHAYTFGFSLINGDAEGYATAQELRSAILRALSRITDDELVENCGAPFDTIKEDE